MLREMRQALLEPLIENCAIHFFLAGHDHHQEHLSAGGFEQIIQGAAARPRVVGNAPKVDGVRRLFASDRLGFALIQASSTRLELRFFGHAGEAGPEELHCRRFDRIEFDEVEARSEDCGSPDAGENRR